MTARVTSAASFEARHRSQVYAGCPCYARAPQDEGKQAMTVSPSPERKRIGLDAGVEKFDLEGPVRDRTMLADELIKALAVD